MNERDEVQNNRLKCGHFRCFEFIKQYWFAFLIQSIYWLLAVVTSFDCLSGELGTQCCGGQYRHNCNEFHILYYAAFQMLRGNGSTETNMALVYNYEYMSAMWAANPLRYLPAQLFLIYPITYLNIYSAYILYSAGGLVANIITIAYLSRIADMLCKNRPRNRLFITIYAILPFQCEAFGWPIVSYVALPLVAAMYYCLRGRKFLGAVLASTSLFFKPTTLFVVLLMVVASFRNFKHFAIVAAGLVIPQIPNIVLFLAFPGMLENFISGQLKWAGWGAIRQTVSFANIFATLAPQYIRDVQLGLTIGIGLLTSIVVMRISDEKSRTMYIFCVGGISAFIALADMWYSQMVYLYGVLTIAICIENADSVHIKQVLGYYAYTILGYALVPIVLSAKFAGDVGIGVYAMIIVTCCCPVLIFYDLHLHLWRKIE